jgi:hypothetical protein
MEGLLNKGVHQFEATLRAGGNIEDEGLFGEFSQNLTAQVGNGDNEVGSPDVDADHPAYIGVQFEDGGTPPAPRDPNPGLTNKAGIDEFIDNGRDGGTAQVGEASHIGPRNAVLVDPNSIKDGDFV